MRRQTKRFPAGREFAMSLGATEALTASLDGSTWEWGVAEGLPSGTVTFLFTDIEGSTGLWDAFPDDMRTALALHDAVVKAAAERHGGHLVKNTGDGLFVAFPSASAAATTAIEAQADLAEADWPTVVGALGSAWRCTRPGWIRWTVTTTARTSTGWPASRRPDTAGRSCCPSRPPR
jgi:class 3 adenylate cyclase